MKKLISFVVAAICATSVTAQVQSDIRTATLIHGGQTTVFYDASAFKEACEAAENNDVIILSPGDFSSASITKSLTIYGVGYETDTVSGASPTKISRITLNTRIDYDETGGQHKVHPKVKIEGLVCELYISSSDAILENLEVRKCKVSSLHIGPESKNCKISQSVIQSMSSQAGSYFSKRQNQFNFENCWIASAFGGDIESTINYDHCVIRGVSHPSGSYGYAHYTNSIIGNTLPDNCTAYNNIFTVSSIGSNITGDNNWLSVTVDGIFADAEQGFTYSATNDFALRFPQKYVGTDGTEVGINGGIAPFDRISPLPRILSSDIDLRTTDDGKLKVNIQVEAQTRD